ncbi:carbohydrate-binding protein [Streptomyces sp. NPDC021224]|uniref:carbohydrate-binding protein n=1 Tax=unclassified Streptomyces TaxID=2593676 RepID=UPI0037881DFC
MTAGQDGTPENDDPFGYLYRAEDGSEQPAAPRASYNQVQRVGERRPQPQQQGGYGYPQQQGGQQQGGYGYPPQQQGGQQQGGYGYPPQQPYGQGQGQGPRGPQQGGPPQYTRQQPQYAPGGPDDGGHRGGGGDGGDGNRRGLLIAAGAVVVVVAIVIAVAMTRGSGDKKPEAKDSTPAATATSAPTTEPTPSDTPTQFASDKVDAATLVLGSPAAVSNQWTGASAANGTYVDHMNQAGASVTWKVTVPTDGSYTFFINYGNAGPDATLSLTVDGKMRTTPVKLRNYGNYTSWDKAWNNTTYAWVTLKAGENTLQLSYQPTDTGGVNLDQLWLKQGQVKK